MPMAGWLNLLHPASAPLLRRAHLTVNPHRRTALSDPQFIDFCILCGCDYLEPLKGVGAKTALKLIKENGDLGAALEALKDKDSKAKKEKQTVPDEWPWQEARELFKHPDVTPSDQVDVRGGPFLLPPCCPSRCRCKKS